MLEKSHTLRDRERLIRTAAAAATANHTKVAKNAAQVRKKREKERKKERKKERQTDRKASIKKRERKKEE